MLALRCWRKQNPILSLLPCHRYHPAGADERISKLLAIPPAFALRLLARPPGLRSSTATVGSPSLRPGSSLTSPRNALSMGYRYLGSILSAIQATGVSGLHHDKTNFSRTCQPSLDTQPYGRVSRLRLPDYLHADAFARCGTKNPGRQFVIRLMCNILP